MTDQTPDSEKMKNLQDKIKALKPDNDFGTDTEEETESLKNAGQMHDGMKAGVELLIPILLGCFGGLYLDKWLGTQPLFLILLLLLGIGAGFLNVYRITKSTN